MQQQLLSVISVVSTRTVSIYRKIYSEGT